MKFVGEKTVNSINLNDIYLNNKKIYIDATHCPKIFYNELNMAKGQLGRFSGSEIMNIIKKLRNDV